ncbi:MAG: hypothetical protein AB7E36_15440 [Salinivirgaceae bacterium]
MKRFINLLLTIILGGVIQAQTISINNTFTNSQSIPLSLKSVQTVQAAFLNGEATLDDNNGFIRILLKGTNDEQVLLFEAFYPLYLPGESINLESIEEVSQINGLIADSIKIYVNNAELQFNTLSLLSTKSAYTDLGGVEDDVFRIAKISRLNQNLIAEGFLWCAGETDDSKLPYSKRIGIYGENTLTFGAEYYAGGIFSAVAEKPSETESRSSSGHLVPEWDWRALHGANNSTSPYFDNNPDYLK